MVDTEGDFPAAMQAAVEEAQARGSPHLGTEHLLLGILRQQQADAVRVLAAQGITYQAVRDYYDAILSSAPRRRVASSGPASAQSDMPAAHVLPLAPAAESVLVAAQALGAGSPRFHHLVAALVAERSGLSAGLIEAVAQSRGVPPHTLADALEQEIQALIER